MAKRFHVFTEDAHLRASVAEGLSPWNPVGRMLGGRLAEAASGARPDVLIVDLSHPLADVLVASVRRMADPPALVGIADGLGACPALPFAVVPQPLEDAVLAFSVRRALDGDARPGRAPAEGGEVVVPRPAAVPAR